VIDGCEFREAIQAVRVEGGVAANVVPDSATVVVNHRFAPDRTPEEAAAHMRAVLDPFLADGDTAEVEDAAAGALPGLTEPLLARLVEASALPVRAKLGWTDVARFASLGMPAVNLGPGDPLVAHAPDEHVDAAALDQVRAALAAILTGA
jgi:succinyl-diaminopimelate desuccinylase